MPTSTIVLLGEHFDQFIENEIKSGRFLSATQVIQCGLRLMEERSKGIELLNQALEEGEKSGVFEEFENEEFKKRMHSWYGKEA